MKSKFLLFLLATTFSWLAYSKTATNAKLAELNNSPIITKNLFLPPPPIAWTKIDDTDPNWVYGGGFEGDECDECYLGTAHSVEAINGTAEYTFSGTDLEVYAETWDGAGSIEVFVDGVSKGVFTQKVEPHGGAMKFASVSGLSSGSHQLKLVSAFEPGTEYSNWVGVDFIRFGTFVQGSVSSVTLNKSNTSITIPNTEQLVATINPEDATNKELTWTSDDPTVATVSATGLVTAISPGTALITVTSVDNPEKTATCQIFVEFLDTWTKADNEDPSWIYSGFTVDNCAGCFGSTSHYANIAGSTAEYTFTGTDVEVYAEKWDGAGTVEIFIDNVSKGIFAQNTEPYGSGLKYASFTGLTNAAHTIKMVTQITDQYSNVDYIRYTVLETTPIKLISFNGKATNNGNTISWETKNEVNFKNFEVLRSADGKIFSQIDVVNSKGGGKYNTIDATPLAGNNFYKLKIIDNDGTFTESKIIVVKDALVQSAPFTIYPNPVKDKVTISPVDKNSRIKVIIFDLQGKKILSKQIVGTTDLSLGNLVKGVYMIQLINNGDVSTLKLVKE